MVILGVKKARVSVGIRGRGMDTIPPMMMMQGTNGNDEGNKHESRKKNTERTNF